MGPAASCARQCLRPGDGRDGLETLHVGLQDDGILEHDAGTNHGLICAQVKRALGDFVTDLDLKMLGPIGPRRHGRGGLFALHQLPLSAGGRDATARSNARVPGQAPEIAQRPEALPGG